MRSNTANQSPVAPPPVQAAPGKTKFIDLGFLRDDPQPAFPSSKLDFELFEFPHEIQF